MSILWALISSLSFSSANIVIKKSLSNLSIPRTLMMSTLSGFVFLFIFNILTSTQIIFSKEIVIASVLLASAEVLIYLSLYKAFERGNVSIATGIITLYPIFSTLFAFIVLGQFVSTPTIFMIVVMILGAILTSVDWRDIQKNGLGKDDIAKGIGWMLLALALHAVYFPVLFETTTIHPWESTLLYIKLFSAFIIFIIFHLIRKESIIPPKTYIAQTSLLGLFEVLGWAGYTFAGTHTDNAIIITALTSSSALFTTILAYIFLKEKLALLQYVGIVLITIGIVGISA